MLLHTLFLACVNGPADDRAVNHGDDTSDTDAPAESDGDGDGYAAADGDCDDGDATVHPGATDAEVDGLDDDCDGFDGPDLDGDGYADAAHGGDDCDDQVGTTHPGAEEIWDDGVDQDCDGAVDASGSSCAATFVVTLPDGSTTTIDGCGAFALELGVDFDPDATPTLGSVRLSFATRDDAGNDCWVHVWNDRVCEGAPYYDIDPDSDDISETLVAMADCDGVPDGYEDTWGAVRGYTRFDTLDAGLTDTSVASTPLESTIVGRLHAYGAGRLEVEGDFSVAITQLAQDIDGVAACVGTDGDADADGAVGSSYDGPDCEETNPSVYPGSVTESEPDECMRDNDGDGFGDASAVAPYAPGTDCWDAEARTHPGAAARDSASLCTTDRDGDGYGDSAPSYGDAGTDCDDRTATTAPGAAPFDGGACQADADGDDYGDATATGRVTPGTDCDDASAATYPGSVSEGSASECMRDADGDGYGDLAAEPPFDAGTDCDDGDAAIFPGSVAEASPGECLRDGDHDGFGDANVSSPYTPGTDCDDTSAATFPGAAELEDASACMTDADADGYGSDGPAAGVSAGTDCDDADAATSPEDAEVWGDDADNNCNGVTDGRNQLSSSAILRTGAASPNLAAYGLAVGDVDGDGLGDLIVGAYGNSDGAYYAGTTYIVPGAGIAAGTASLDTAAYQLEGADRAAYSGWSVASAGDVDGDGRDDVLIGAYKYGTYTQGRAHLVLSSSLAATVSLASADYTFSGITRYGYLGYAVAGIGDIDADGLADIAIGAYGETGGATASGNVYIYTGATLAGLDATPTTTEADYVIAGATYGDDIGQTLAGIGDVDGDGRDDLAVGGASGCYVFLGSSFGSVAARSVTDADWEFSPPGSSAPMLSGAGDVDGDGLADFLVGQFSSTEGEDYSGRTYLFLGADLGAPGTLSTGDAAYVFAGEDGQDVVGDSTDDWSGWGVSRAGDIDGDGLDDLAIGAHGWDGDAGKAYLVLSAELGTDRDISLGDVRYSVEGVGAEYAGMTLAGGYDVDGDGRDDLVVGAPRWSYSYGRAGVMTAWLE
jgi:hypothetical protein